MANKHNYVVFGHYDSRGGTTAVRIPALTSDWVDKAMQMYNETFGWTPETGVTTAGAGRVVDNIAHRMVFGNGAPAEADLLFVAELHDPHDLDDGERIELDYDYGDQTTAVFIDEATVPPIDDPAWREDRSDDAWAEEKGRWCKEMIDRCLAAPVQMEVIKLEPGWSETYTSLQTRIEARAERAGVKLHYWSSNDDAITLARRKAYMDQLDRLEQAVADEKKDRLVVLDKTAETVVEREWGDDAYGFCVQHIDEETYG